METGVMPSSSAVSRFIFKAAPVYAEERSGIPIPFLGRSRAGAQQGELTCAGLMGHSPLNGSTTNQGALAGQGWLLALL